MRGPVVSGDTRSAAIRLVLRDCEVSEEMASPVTLVPSNGKTGMESKSAIVSKRSNPAGRPLVFAVLVKLNQRTRKFEARAWGYMATKRFRVLQQTPHSNHNTIVHCWQFKDKTDLFKEETDIATNPVHPSFTTYSRSNSNVTRELNLDEVREMMYGRIAILQEMDKPFGERKGLGLETKEDVEKDRESFWIMWSFYSVMSSSHDTLAWSPVQLAVSAKLHKLENSLMAFRLLVACMANTKGMPTRMHGRSDSVRKIELSAINSENTRVRSVWKTHRPLCRVVFIAHASMFRPGLLSWEGALSSITGKRDSSGAAMPVGKGNWLLTPYQFAKCLVGGVTVKMPTSPNWGPIEDKRVRKIFRRAATTCKEAFGIHHVSTKVDMATVVPIEHMPPCLRKLYKTSEHHKYDARQTYLSLMFACSPGTPAEHVVAARESVLRARFGHTSEKEIKILTRDAMAYKNKSKGYKPMRCTTVMQRGFCVFKNGNMTDKIMRCHCTRNPDMRVTPVDKCVALSKSRAVQKPPKRPHVPIAIEEKRK